MSLGGPLFLLLVSLLALALSWLVAGFAHRCARDAADSASHAERAAERARLSAECVSPRPTGGSSPADPQADAGPVAPSAEPAPSIRQAGSSTPAPNAAPVSPGMGAATE